MIKETDKYYLNLEEPHKSCLLALRNIILNQDQLLAESLKAKTPCFKYNDKIFCYLWVDKETNEPCLLIENGKLLNHPELEKTKHATIEILRIDPNEDLPIKIIQSILTQSLNTYRKN